MNEPNLSSKSIAYGAEGKELTKDERPPIPGAQWRSPREAPFELRGFPWFNRDGVYRRLPKAPAEPIPAMVDTLADCTAGGQIRFRTDSPALYLSARLTGPADMYHMPATGQCGFDCYVGGPAGPSYASTTSFPPGAVRYEAVLFQGFERAMRDVTIHFPLYQGVEEVKVGVAEGASVEPPRPFGGAGKLVFYGTSITQGGCASRPGMAYPSIVGRRLDQECVNLGLSGNGKGEPALARLISEIEGMELLVLDYVPNVTAEQFEETLPVFVDIVRAAHPTLPILVVSGIKYAMDAHKASVRDHRVRCRNFARAFVARRNAEGDAAIAFLNGDTLLGRGYEDCTVDGVHPTDLGFHRIGEAMAKAIRKKLANVDVR